MQAIEARHAVRSYIDEPLAPEAVEVLREAIARVNEEANLNIPFRTQNKRRNK